MYVSTQTYGHKKPAWVFDDHWAAYDKRIIYALKVGSLAGKLNYSITVSITNTQVGRGMYASQKHSHIFMKIKQFVYEGSNDFRKLCPNVSCIFQRDCGMVKHFQLCSILNLQHSLRPMYPWSNVSNQVKESISASVRQLISSLPLEMDFSPYIAP